MRSLLTPARARTWIALGVTAAVLAGIALRFIALSPLWRDEALAAHLASLPVGDLPEALRHGSQPPLYFWLLHGWTNVFGDGDAAVRALAGVCGVLTLPLLWRLGRRTGGPPVARGVLVLFALSPFAVRYATDAGMYAMVMLLVVAGALLLGEVLDRPRARTVAGLVVVSGALLWTHYWSIFLLATVGLLLVARWWRQRGHRPTTRWALVGLLGGALLYLPWLPRLLDHMAHTGTPWARPSRPTVVAQATIGELGGGDFAEALLLGTLLVVLTVAAYAHLGRAELREPAEPLDVRVLTVVAGGTLVLGSLASFAAGIAFAPRFAAVVVPLVLVVAAVGLTRVRPIWMQRAIGATVVLLSGVALVHNAGDLRTGARELAERIEDRAGRSDVVVVCPDQLAPSLVRELTALGSELPVLPYPSGADPATVDWRDYAERNRTADPGAFAADLLDEAAGAPIWMVWHGGYRTFGRDCEALLDLLGSARPAVEVGSVPDAQETAILVRLG